MLRSTVTSFLENKRAMEETEYEKNMTILKSKSTCFAVAKCSQNEKYDAKKEN